MIVAPVASTALRPSNTCAIASRTDPVGIERTSTSARKAS